MMTERASVMMIASWLLSKTRAAGLSCGSVLSLIDISIAHRPDQTGEFGHRAELPARKHTDLQQLHANKRFGTDDQSGCHIDFRLVIPLATRYLSRCLSVCLTVSDVWIPWRVSVATSSSYC